MGIQQNNSFIKLTIDVWEDKVFYNEQKYPAGYFAAAVLNISGDEIMELMEAGSAVLAHHQTVASGNKRKLGALLPALKADLLRLAELLWKYPPFCFNDKEHERYLIEVMLAPETLNDISRYDLPARDFFLRYLDGIVRIPTALYHFIYAGCYFEAAYLRRLKKRSETYLAVAAHDCFNSELFWSGIHELQVPDVEPFTITPDLRSSHVFARHLKREKEMVFVNRYFFDSSISFYTFDLMNGLHHVHAPSKCRGCGKYFLTTNGHMPKYCDGIAPHDSRMTCWQYGAMTKQKEKNKQHLVYRLFTARTNTIHKHHQRGKISDELRREALYVAECLRGQSSDGQRLRLQRICPGYGTGACLCGSQKTLEVRNGVRTMSMNTYTVAGDCPSNEELALRIQAGDTYAAELLLSQNEGYITELALKYSE